MLKCGVKGCDRNEYASGFCSKHYNRLLTTGTLEDGPRARLPFEKRFWKYVKREGRDDCWPWIGNSWNQGYGYIGLGGRGDGKELSHRAAWRLTYGEMPNLAGWHGTVVRHKCDNRACCNPAHLEIGTQADNVRDMHERGRRPRKYRTS